MKEFKFDHSRKSWDRYGAFHNSDWGIVEFETGEVIVRSSSVDNRMMYDKYGIQIVASTDTECPPLYIDKECTEPCPKAWLTQGGYTPLAIDYEQKVAFQLQTPMRSGQTRKQGLHIQNHLGSHVRDARGYWAGHGRLPITNGKTRLQKPNPEYKKKVLGILNQVQVAVTAAFRMKEPKNYWNNGVYPAKLEWQDMTVEDIVAEICNDNGAMRDVAMKGFKLPRQLKEVDFLYIKGEQ